TLRFRSVNDIWSSAGGSFRHRGASFFQARRATKNTLDMIPYGFLYRGMTRNQTVSLDDDGDLVFRALADKSRRELLDRLYERGGQSLNELCQGLAMTRPAVAKHLRVLEEASLVTFEWKGREKLHYLNPVPINGIAERWIGKFERPRLRVLSDLKDLLEAPAPGAGRPKPKRGRDDD